MKIYKLSYILATSIAITACGGGGTQANNTPSNQDVAIIAPIPDITPTPVENTNTAIKTARYTQQAPKCESVGVYEAVPIEPNLGGPEAVFRDTCTSALRLSESGYNQAIDATNATYYNEEAKTIGGRQPNIYTAHSFDVYGQDLTVIASATYEYNDYQEGAQYMDVEHWTHINASAGLDLEYTVYDDQVLFNSVTDEYGVLNCAYVIEVDKGVCVTSMGRIDFDARRFPLFMQDVVDKKQDVAYSVFNAVIAYVVEK